MCLSAYGVTILPSMVICLCLSMLCSCFTGMLTVCIHTPGLTVNDLSSLCKHSHLWANEWSTLNSATGGHCLIAGFSSTSLQKKG